MEQQTLKPGDRVIVSGNYPDNKLFNGDTGRVVETAQGMGVEFDHDEPGTTVHEVVDGGEAVNILEAVEKIVPPLVPGDLPMDTKDDIDECFCQLAALFEAYQATDFGRIQTRITSTMPKALAKAYLAGLVAGTWHANGIDNGLVTEKGLKAIEEVVFTFAALYLDKDKGKSRRKVMEKSEPLPKTRKQRKKA